MSREHDYYIAKGRSLQAIEDYWKWHNDYWKAVLALLKEHGAIATDEGKHGIYQSAGLFSGVQIPRDQPVPNALRRDRRDPRCCVPNSRTLEGRALKAGLKKIPEISSWQLTQSLCGDSWAWVGASDNGRGMASSGYGLEKIGDLWILSSNAGGRVPFDAEPLARSAYWTMREGAETTATPVDGG